MQNFYQVLTENTRQKPHKTIIYDGKLKLSNAELLAYSKTIASYLADFGVQAGDKVALLVTNSWQFIAHLFAINKLGAVTIPINTFLTADEVAYIINDGQAKILVAR